MKKYHQINYNLEVNEKKILRKTDQCLFYYDDFLQRKRKLLKKTFYEWFPLVLGIFPPPKEEAIQVYRKSLEDKIVEKQSYVQDAKDELQKFNEKYPQSSRKGC